MFIRSFGS